jgi:hypothetical protein
MAIDVADWLRGQGLEQYAEAFRNSDIDESVLSHLTADDLIEVGVASIGHRRKTGVWTFRQERPSDLSQVKARRCRSSSVCRPRR